MPPIALTALGTQWLIEIFEPITQERRHSLTQDLSALLCSIEERFSRFRTDSFVGQLNETGYTKTSDPDLERLFTYGKKFYKDTQGVFNILVGDALLARGYDASYSLVVRDQEPIIGDPLTDLVPTDDGWQLLRGQIDLGGIGKGWAIDQLALLLRNSGIAEFLINGGGDLYGTSEQGSPITIYLEHPTEPQTYLGTTTILNQGFAASSQHKRKWHTKRGETSHLVGNLDTIDASFVIAPTALTADMLATTALLLPTTHSNELARTYTAFLAVYNATSQTFVNNTNFPFQPLL